jgi:hypothetical protein
MRAVPFFERDESNKVEHVQTFLLPVGRYITDEFLGDMVVPQ